MQCFESSRNIGEAFGYGGPKVVRCQREATKAVRIGPGVKVVNGWRPTCWICAKSYPGYTVKPLSEIDLNETTE